MPRLILQTAFPRRPKELLQQASQHGVSLLSLLSLDMDYPVVPGVHLKGVLRVKNTTCFTLVVVPIIRAVDPATSRFLVRLDKKLETNFGCMTVRLPKAPMILLKIFRHREMREPPDLSLRVKDKQIVAEMQQLKFADLLDKSKLSLSKSRRIADMSSSLLSGLQAHITHMKARFARALSCLCRACTLPYISS
jgi:hypothetical protein